MYFIFMVRMGIYQVENHSLDSFYMDKDFLGKNSEATAQL